MKRNFKGSVKTMFHSVDRFKMDVNFREGKSSYTTWFGSVLSLIILSLTLFHGSDKFEELINFENMTYSRTNIVLDRNVTSLDYKDTILSAFTLDFTPFLREDNDEMMYAEDIVDYLDF